MHTRRYVCLLKREGENACALVYLGVCGCAGNCETRKTRQRKNSNFLLFLLKFKITLDNVLFSAFLMEVLTFEVSTANAQTIQGFSQYKQVT